MSFYGGAGSSHASYLSPPGRITLHALTALVPPTSSSRKKMEDRGERVDDDKWRLGGLTLRGANTHTHVQGGNHPGSDPSITRVDINCWGPSGTLQELAITEDRGRGDCLALC